MEKQFLDEDFIVRESFRLGARIFASGFRPTFIIGLWRGGSSVGIYVQECLQTLGVKTDHISLRTSYRGLPEYQTMVEKPENIRVHGIQYLVENLNADDKLLIVDDVYSSGSSINAVLNRLRRTLKRNMPSEVNVATLWQRHSAKALSAPDFCLHSTDKWLVFPYELKGLSRAEIKQFKPFVLPLLVEEHLITDD